MRQIDADEIIKWADDSVSQYGGTYSIDMLNMFGLFKEVINKAPTVNKCDNCDLMFLEKTRGDKT